MMHIFEFYEETFPEHTMNHYQGQPSAQNSEKAEEPRVMGSQEKV